MTKTHISTTSSSGYDYLLYKAGRVWFVEVVRRFDSEVVTSTRYTTKRLAQAWITQNT